MCTRARLHARGARIKHTYTHAHAPPLQGVSKHYYTSISPELPGHSPSAPSTLEIFLLGVHFRAFPTDPEPCARREAQARPLA